MHGRRRLFSAVYPSLQALFAVTALQSYGCMALIPLLLPVRSARLLWLYHAAALCV
eukprot:COSAG06_NODE_42634_length_380_cov_0.483986_1_plen_55_part_10